jgi:hypothetical protein
MKLHHFLFATMLVAGAWITNFKASYYENQGRTPASTSSHSAMQLMATSAGN